MSDRLELWRTLYVKDAYEDQTGKKQWGRVVYEQILVTDTGERFDVDDGYGVHPGIGRVYVAEDGRRFSYRPNTIDYWGGGSYRELGPRRFGVLDTNIAGERDAPKPPGFWERARERPAGYCYPDGSGPVEPLPRGGEAHPDRL